MKILYVSTNDKKFLKEALEQAKEARMQYVEMENEILVNTDILIKIEDNLTNYNIDEIFLREKESQMSYSLNKICEYNQKDKLLKNNLKKQQKKESQYVKTKLKQNRFLK